ncbi:PH domain-containing protein [Amycolatopsis albispora]|uniref:DUF1648 domain-containing protein n=1 Tax=Amycolatopsis albispora TaxID=1804986 RepID=A0A344LFD2_9PSEU|nr:PH domain-containing protein [Amycolatopsis albispora]AXB46756.1 hypothetical protein A4R43_33525 [Amycolatopsis albispora]
MNRLRISLATGGLPAVLAIATGLLHETWRDRLPDPIAVHWQNGSPDGTAEAATFVPIMLTITAVLLVVGSLLLNRRPVRFGAGFAAGIAAFPAVTALAVLIANLDAADWRQADNFLVVLAVPVGGAIVAGLLGALIAPNGPQPVKPAGPSVGLRPGERASWSGGASNNYLPLLALLTPLTLVSGNPPLVLYPVLTIAVAVALYAVTRLRVRVGADGVTIRLIGFRRQMPLDRIAGADVDRVSFWTGLGVRVNPLTGDTAYKVRGGEALRLDLKSGRSVYVTVDRPREAAGLLNDLLARDQASPGTGSAARS